jgi:hypothetical protein
VSFDLPKGKSDLPRVLRQVGNLIETSLGQCPASWGLDPASDRDGILKLVLRESSILTRLSLRSRDCKQAAVAGGILSSVLTPSSNCNIRRKARQSCSSPACLPGGDEGPSTAALVHVGRIATMVFTCERAHAPSAVGGAGWRKPVGASESGTHGAGRSSVVASAVKGQLAFMRIRSKLKMVPISEAPRVPEAVSARNDRHCHGPASDSALELALG